MAVAASISVSFPSCSRMSSVTSSSTVPKSWASSNSLWRTVSGSKGFFGCNFDVLEIESSFSQNRFGQGEDLTDAHVGLTVRAIHKRSPKRLKYTSAGSRKSSSMVYVQVDPAGFDIWKLDSVVELIKSGAVGVIPTDTVYAIVCDLKNRDSVDRLYRIKDIDSRKPLSILCRSFQDIDTYTMGFPRGNSHGQTNVFRAARQCLPGPYTFILHASKEMPKQCITFGGSAAVSCAPRKSVGVRMPDDDICKAILEKLDEPLLCTSVKMPAVDQWMLDPVIIGDTYGTVDGREGLDFVVDGGVRVADPSTVVDMTGVKPVVLRPGKGIVEDWMLMESRDSTDLELETVGGRLNPYA